MTGLFTSILNISITAGYAAVAVIIIRILLKKLPKTFSYVLWLAVLIRLIFPFNFKSNISFLNLINPKVQTLSGTIKYVPQNIGLMQSPKVLTGINSISNVVSSNLPSAAETSSVNPMQIVLLIASVIWAAGAAAILIYSIISYIKLKNKVKTATLVKENIYETDKISSPFLCGFVRPKIYVPVGLSPDELSYILLHEKTHIKRFDYIIKPFAYLLLIIHWFNPVMWISFTLMGKDMEMSCDENVIKEMGSSIKGNYSASLLSMSMKRSGLIMGSPLCFGESNIKSRIKNILNYKKPAFWVVIIIAAATGVLIFSLVSNPKGNAKDVSIYSGYNITKLMKNKTSYVGNNSKDAALISAMFLTDGINQKTIELQTKKQPYGMTINYEKNNSTYLEDNTMYNYLYRNSIMLFSLIDNVDNINCKISNGTQVQITYSFSREETDKLMGIDVRKYSDNAGNLKSLIDIINNKNFSIPDVPIGKKIDKYLEAIVSSPKTSSNPYDYINAHRTEYESILKMGDAAYDYILSEFHKTESNDLKGYIMMALCKDILGTRNNITDNSLKPAEWFARVSPYDITGLGDFKANTSDKIEQFVYDAAEKKYSNLQYGFTVTAPTVFGSYEEGNKLKIFATVFYSRYKLYNKTLTEVSGGVVPAAITYTKTSDGKYILTEYREAMDGSYFTNSIKKFCTMPESNTEIKGLYSKIIKDYGNNENRNNILLKNLKYHLNANRQYGITLKQTDGKLVPLT